MRAKQGHRLDAVLTSLWMLSGNLRVAISSLVDDLAHQFDQRQIRQEHDGLRRARDHSGFVDAPGFLTRNGLGSLEIGSSRTRIGE